MTSTISSLFADFFLATGPTTATRENDIIQEMQYRTYLTSFVMNGTKDFKDFFQGGDRIQDDIILDLDSTFENYDPDDEFTYRSSEITTQWTVNWRFSKAHMKITDHEVELNGGGAGVSGAALFDRFKNLRRIKEANFWTGVCNGVEDSWFAAPNNTTMEQDSGKDPYSLFCFVNDYTSDGPSITTATVPTGFTTIQGINPATKGRWSSRLQSYNSYPDETAPRWVGWDAFSKMWKQTEFHRMPKMSQLGDGMTHPGLIATSEDGATLYEQALQFTNDPLSAASRSKGDPTIDELRYRGAALHFFQGLSEAGAYSDGNGGVTGYVPEFTDSADADGTLITTKLGLNTPTQRTGPRFFFLDNRYMRIFFKRGRMFKTKKIVPERQPWTTIIVMDLWRNHYCRSRQRLGCVHPSTNLGRP